MSRRIPVLRGRHVRANLLLRGLDVCSRQLDFVHSEALPSAPLRHPMNADGWCASCMPHPFAGFAMASHRVVHLQLFLGKPPSESIFGRLTSPRHVMHGVYHQPSGAIFGQ